MDTTIVTRHAALVEYLIEEGIVSKDTPVLAHATADDVRDKHVIGVLPLHLAALARQVTIVPLALAPEDRGRELDLARVREIAGSPQTFAVCEIPPAEGECEVVAEQTSSNSPYASIMRVLAPKGTQFPARGDWEDLGEAGNVHTFRFRPSPEGPLCFFSRGFARDKEGLVEAACMEGTGAALSLFFARPRAKFLLCSGYKCRHEEHLCVEGPGVIRPQTPQEIAGDEGKSLGSSLADKLREAGIV